MCRHVTEHHDDDDDDDDASSFFVRLREEPNPDSLTLGSSCPGQTPELLRETKSARKALCCCVWGFGFGSIEEAQEEEEEEHDRESEAQETYGQRDRSQDRCGDDQPRRRERRLSGSQGSGQRRTCETGMPDLQSTCARQQEHAHPP